MDRRATDNELSGWQKAGVIWARFGRDVVTAFAVGLAAWSVWATQIEGDERRDQTCRIDERKQALDVKQLVQTYKYLLALTPEQLQEPLNRFVLANISQTETEARADDAPMFCDEPGVGLREPDPVIPKRPKRIDELLHPHGVRLPVMHDAIFDP